MVVAAVWHGDREQQYALLLVLEHHCTCDQVERKCAAHQILVSQRQIDGLLFARHLFEQLLSEEFMVA